jgi:hypothetical protein
LRDADYSLGEAGDAAMPVAACCSADDGTVIMLKVL